MRYLSLVNEMTDRLEAIMSQAPYPYHRRLSDKILLAFEQACEKRELDVAELLVKALELTLTRAGGKDNVDKRNDLGPVLDAYARLQQLRDSITV